MSLLSFCQRSIVMSHSHGLHSSALEWRSTDIHLPPEVNQAHAHGAHAHGRLCVPLSHSVSLSHAHTLALSRSLLSRSVSTVSRPWPAGSPAIHFLHSLGRCALALSRCRALALSHTRHTLALARCSLCCLPLAASRRACTRPPATRTTLSISLSLSLSCALALCSRLLSASAHEQ